MIAFIYNSILSLFFIPTILYFLIKSRKNIKHNFVNGWKQRLGFWKIPINNLKNKPVLWFHCASLGEVRAIEPLINELNAFKILLTVLTPSGYNYAVKKKMSDVIYFAPLDFTFITKRLVKKINPKAIIFVETELWPGLIFGAKANNSKIIVVNGRLSSNSYPKYKATGFFWKKVLKHIDCICARTNEDARRLINIGCNPDNVLVTGNIKYDMDNSIKNVSKEEFGFSNSDTILVAGSTRPGEEKIIIETWEILKKKYLNFKLVIAPRHINKVHGIIKLLKKKNIPYVLRSGQKSKNFDCFILDTFGELSKFYFLCDISFVGRSFISKGGQNPIEPASYSKPVLFGPNMQNFLTEADTLKNNGGGFMIKNKKEFIDIVDKLISDKQYYKNVGQKAYQSVIEQKGALKKTKDAVLYCVK